MREKLENALWRAMWKLRFTVEEKILNDERGDSNMVSVIILIIIVIAVAVIFRDALMGAVQDVMNQFTDFINETNP